MTQPDAGTPRPIVDAHHHIWGRADQPWLQGPTVPRIFGPYEAIKRDYPIDEYLQDIAGCGVEASIYVQTNWAKERCVEEVEWVQSIAEQNGWPHGIVSFVDLQDDGAAATMNAQSQYSLMRGVRQQLHWHENTLYRFASRPDEMNTPAFRRNFARLQEYGWLFELQVFSSQMKDGAALAAAFPEVTLVLEHAGMPEDLTPTGLQAWRDGMKRLADQPNVNTKLSGLGTFIHRNDPSHIGAIIGETIEIFGPQRCVWGSNFPIEKLWTDYASIVSAVRQAIAHLDDTAQDAVLSGNARRLYRLTR
jgi:predicted TIM-barrel fold metal-dependent hydrolase